MRDANLPLTGVAQRRAQKGFLIEGANGWDLYDLTDLKGLGISNLVIFRNLLSGEPSPSGDTIEGIPFSDRVYALLF
jgi:hypothetical protein